MSLKTFHLVFVTASVLLMLSLTGWCLAQYRDGGQADQLVYAAISMVCAVGLVIYGRIFLKKLKHISYL
jgi:hypothetical protein